MENYDPSNRTLAMNTLMEHNGLVTGLIYQNTEQPSYQEQIHGYAEQPLIQQDLRLSDELFNELVEEFM